MYCFSCFLIVTIAYIHRNITIYAMQWISSHSLRCKWKKREGRINPQRLTLPPGARSDNPGRQWQEGRGFLKRAKRRVFGTSAETSLLRQTVFYKRRAAWIMESVFFMSSSTEERWRMDGHGPSAISNKGLVCSNLPGHLNGHGGISLALTCHPSLVTEHRFASKNGNLWPLSVVLKWVTSPPQPRSLSRVMNNWNVI